MAKKPFSVRVQPELINRYKALATVAKMDNDKMLADMVLKAEERLTKEQREVYEGLLRIWKDEE